MTIPMHFPDTVQSVVQTSTNGPLIAAAATLWIEDPTDLVLDVTYGRGRFWTDYRPARLETHDLALDGVDFRHLPEADATIDVVIFDPPYISRTDEELSGLPDFLDRYGLDARGPENFAAVEELYNAGTAEASRVLVPGGRLFVKCIDYVDGKLFRTGHRSAVEAAFAAGLKQVDEFVHYSGTGPISQTGDQVHSRRAHSFLAIFRKPKR